MIVKTMVWSLPWKARVPQVGKQIPWILWNPKTDSYVHTSQYCIPVLSQINPIMTFHPISLKSILILPSHLCLRLSSGLLQAGFTLSILYSIFFSPVCATLPTLLILQFCYLGEEHRTWSSSLWSFLLSPATSSISGSNIFHSTLFSHASAHFLPEYLRPSFTLI